MGQDRIAGGDHHAPAHPLQRPTRKNPAKTRVEREDQRAQEETAAARAKQPSAPRGSDEPRRETGGSVEAHEDRSKEPDLSIAESVLRNWLVTTGISESVIAATAKTDMSEVASRSASRCVSTASPGTPSAGVRHDLLSCRRGPPCHPRPPAFSAP